MQKKLGNSCSGQRRRWAAFSGMIGPLVILEICILEISILETMLENV